MYIHEAIEAVSFDYPYMRRKSWTYPTRKAVIPVMIQPTDGPDGCLIFSMTDNNPRRGWQPTASDLAADDWETTAG